jgi:succinate dehydrogenase / fumarate reductase membrane anchor subunit
MAVRIAATGLRAWLVQRASAVYMLLFIVFFLAHFAVAPPHSYPAWHVWMTSYPVRVITTVFFAALLAHAWVGLRDVIIDYVHAAAFRVCALALLGFGLAAMAVWIVRILWIGNRG